MSAGLVTREIYRIGRKGDIIGMRGNKEDSVGKEERGEMREPKEGNTLGVKNKKSRGGRRKNVFELYRRPKGMGNGRG